MPCLVDVRGNGVATIDGSSGKTSSVAHPQRGAAESSGQDGDESGHLSGHSVFLRDSTASPVPIGTGAAWKKCSRRRCCRAAHCSPCPPSPRLVAPHLPILSRFNRANISAGGGSAPGVAHNV